MFTILTSVLKIFGGGVLTGISNDLKEAYQAKLDAGNDKERIAADERIAILEARKTSISLAQQSPVERWIRFGFAFPFVVYLNKLLIWDKVLGWGVTDSLSPELTQLFWIVIGGYFVDATVRGVMNGRK
jgi:hypothetical protein